MATTTMDKAKRLELLKQAGARAEERERLQFGEIAASREEVEETVHDMDTWREEFRSRRSETEALNSDEA